MSYRVALLIVAASMLGFAGAARAESVTVTKAVQDACAWEYDKFCNQYGLGSELLDICFKQNARNMTKACVDALVAAGVPTFGPDAGAARIETSKAFCRSVAEAAGVPMACGRAFSSLAPALEFADHVASRLDHIPRYRQRLELVPLGLGRPVWVLCPLRADWRWEVDGRSSPWYASARVFRPVITSEWSPVVANLVNALAALRVPGG